MWTKVEIGVASWLVFPFLLVGVRVAAVELREMRERISTGTRVPKKTPRCTCTAWRVCARCLGLIR